MLNTPNSENAVVKHGNRQTTLDEVGENCTNKPEASLRPHHSACIQMLVYIYII